MKPSASRLRGLVSRIASGELLGSAAFDALVAEIAAQETPAGASQQAAAQVRDEVVLGLSHDRELCRLIYQAENRARDTQQPPRLSDARRASVPLVADVQELVVRRSSKQPGRQGEHAGKRSRPGRRNARAKQPHDRDVADDDLGAAVGPGGAKLKGIAAFVVFGVGAGLLWWASGDSECDKLVARLCLEESTECAPEEFRAALEEKKIDDGTCGEAKGAVDAALKDAKPARHAFVFREALVKTLGFDPRGKRAKVVADPAIKEPPKPVAIAKGQTTVSSVVVDGSHLYFTRSDAPGAYRVRSTGGLVELLGGGPDPIDIVATRDYVYWLSRTAGASSIWVDPKRGKHEPSTLPTPEFDPFRAVFMGPEFAFADRKTGAIAIAPVSGGPVRKLTPGNTPPEPEGGSKRKRKSRRRQPEVPVAPPVLPISMAGDGTSVVFAMPGPQGSINVVPADGSAPARVLVAGRPNPDNVKIDSGQVYWTETASGAIMRVPVGGGEAQVVAPKQSGPTGITFDATQVYWVNSTGGTIMATPKLGGAMQAVVGGLTNPHFVAVDGAAIYWVSNGSMFRLPKPPPIVASSQKTG